jgi:hypothetical protein
MKKTFRLNAPRQADARVRDKIRHEVNKYVKRGRRKDLPEGYFRWEFACRVGPTEDAAESLKLDAVGTAIDRVAAEGAETVFVEILASAGKRSAGAE